MAGICNSIHQTLRASQAYSHLSCWINTLFPCHQILRSATRLYLLRRKSIFSPASIGISVESTTAHCIMANSVIEDYSKPQPRRTVSKRLLKLVGLTQEQNAALLKAEGATAPSVATQCAVVPQPCQPSITDLSEDLLELILQHLDKDTPEREDQEAYYAAAGVCSAWRRTAVPLFFKDQWDFGKVLHPKMLLRMCPQPVDGSDGSGLLRCCVLRETLRPAATKQYCLFLGARPTVPAGKLLLCAQQQGKGSYAIATSRQVSTDNVAQLSGNLLRTSYSLSPNSASTWVRKVLGEYGDDSGSDDASPLLLRQDGMRGIDALASITYHTPKSGTKLPRRLDVKLPLPEVTLAAAVSDALSEPSSVDSGRLCFDDVLPPVFTAAEANVVIGPSEIARLASRLSREGSCCSDFSGYSSNSGYRSSRSSNSGEGSSSKRSSESGESSVASSIASAEPASLRLESKPPTWNEELRCWCLDFKSRCKVPSVKNMQLVCVGDSHARVVLQFGKLDANSFFLDFNPCVVSALQAFSILLTHFDSRLNLQVCL